MRFVRVVLFLVMASSLAGCASYFKRKECEKTNWYTHGEKVAQEGGSLEADHFLNECRAAEAQVNEPALDQGYKAGRTDYCKPQTVFLTGKKGDKFKASMCDGEPMKLLHSKYQAGLAEYCRPSNGVAAGQTGKKYQNVCPADVEKDFIPEFNKGRKKYLEGQIIAKEDQVEDIERSIRDLEMQKQTILIKMAATPKTNVVVRDRSYDGRRVRDTVRVKETEESQGVRAELERDMDNVDWQIKAKRSEQEKVRAEIRTLRAEIATL